MEVINETSANETPLPKHMQVAKDFFADRPYIEQVVVIEKLGDGKEAEISVIDKTVGNRVTVRVGVSDYLEANAESLATRFSNTRTEIVHC